MPKTKITHCKYDQENNDSDIFFQYILKSYITFYSAINMTKLKYYNKTKIMSITVNTFESFYKYSLKFLI